MPREVERRVGEWIVRIDRTLCVGFGDCIDLAPDLFELDDEDVAAFLATPAVIDRDRLLEACAACPVDALTVLDADGNQLAP